jgi:hypothetical protein
MSESLLQTASPTTPLRSHQTERDAFRLLVILPRGEAIRNFVYTGALDELDRDGDLTVLSVLPSKELEQLLRSRYGNVFEFDNAPDAWIVRFLREILDVAHGRYLWSEAAKERWRIRNEEAATRGKWLNRSVKKLLAYPFSSTSGIQMLADLERASSRWFRSDSYVKLLQESKPSLVFNASHVHSQVAIQAIQAAQWLNIPTATFLFSWDNLTSQGRIIPPYDYYFAWNSQIRDDLLKIYPTIKRESVFVTGTPQFDFHFRSEFYWSREEFCRHVGADAKRPIVLYSTGMPNHMPGEEVIVESIADILAGLTEFGCPQLLLRVYPKDQTTRWRDLERRRPDILMPKIPWEPAFQTPKPEDAYLLTNTLKHSELGLNVASTVSLELCMFDKPVINIGFDPPGFKPPTSFERFYSFDHYRPVVESGGVEVAWTPESLKSMIVQNLTNPQVRSVQRRALLAQMFGDTLDGMSSRRVAEQLIRLAAVKRSR